MRMSVTLYFILTFILNLVMADPGSGDYCKFSLNHTMCRRSGTAATKNCGDNFKSEKVTTELKNLILYLHNELRSNLALGKEKLGRPGPQPPASNMMQMEWDNELAEIAQTFANRCELSHQCINCSMVDRFDVGQSIFQTFSNKCKGKIDWEKVVYKWYSEVQNFKSDYVAPYIYQRTTGHYTQIAWWNTRLIGCGASQFKKEGWWSTLYVCNYGPMGNRILSQMYEIGSPCNTCPNGTTCSTKFNGLCKMNKKIPSNEMFHTDTEFKALAKLDYLKQKAPHFQISDLNLNKFDNMLRGTNESSNNPAVRLLKMFFHNSIPQKFDLKGAVDPPVIIPVNKPTIPIGRGKRNTIQ